MTSHHRCRAGRPLVALLALLGFAFPTTLAQSQWATITGTIYDPTGATAEGFRLVFKVADGDVEFMSPPSDARGRYRVSLPAGNVYVLHAAFAPDGTELEVPSMPPVEIGAGVRRVDVRFRPGETAPVVTPRGDEKTPRSWWKLLGSSVGAVLVLGSVLDLDDDQAIASPSSP